VLTHGSRQAAPWLIFDVGQNMNVAISHAISIDGVALSTLSASAFHRILGRPDSEEKIRLHGGAVRIREVWKTGVSVLRDEQEIVCLLIDAAAVRVVVAAEVLPDVEREFLQRFVSAKKEIGHSYTLAVEDWRLTIDFRQSEKRRGAGSAIRRLSRVIVSHKMPNQAPEPTALAVTPRACARVAPSSAVAHL
jgi:hypothetical protein